LQHVKIFLPCHFEVNSITHFGVIFHQNVLNFNTIILYLKTFISYSFWNIRRKVLLFFLIWWKKGQELLDGYSYLLQNCRVGRYRHGAHFCNLNLTSISYDNCVKSYSSWNAFFCWLTAFGYSNNQREATLLQNVK
jgi:hypothetical protein